VRSRGALETLRRGNRCSWRVRIVAKIIWKMMEDEHRGSISHNCFSIRELSVLYVSVNPICFFAFTDLLPRVCFQEFVWRYCWSFAVCRILKLVICRRCKLQYKMQQC